MAEKTIREFPNDVPNCLAEFRKLVLEADWGTGLEAWEAVYGKLPLGIPLSLAALKQFSELKASEGEYRKEEVDRGTDEERKKELLESGVPKFRVTCLRSGSSHCFGSQDVAKDLGGEIQRCFGWAVSMKQFDLEVVLNIQDHHVTFGIALTRESMHRRNIVAFGPTTLRATICYSLVRMGRPQPGDVVCDPLCGGGSIPIEAAVEYRDLLVLAGDSHDMAVERTSKNIAVIPKYNSPLVLLQWDATCLPIATGFVDCIVSDLPFGKRLGSKFDNRKMYPRLLKEWARVVKRGTGRAILLTQDKNHLQKAIYICYDYWKQYSFHHANVGGLCAGVFCLKRTEVEFL